MLNPEQKESPCPVCGIPFKKGGLRLHITHQAINECFWKELNYIYKMPHMEYYKANTKATQSVIQPRKWNK